jgi:tetratricopeptide (TPR) repeat protein
MNLRSILKYSFILIFTLFAITGLISISYARSQTPVAAMFYKANELFKQQEYEKARDMYQAVLDQGVHSGNIYYNLGNTYFKLGELGKAIVNYERAKILLPQDSDVRANLEYALSLCNNTVIPQKQNWILAAARKTSGYFILDNWSKIAYLAYLILLGLLSGFIVSRRPGLKKAVIVCAFILGFMLFIWAVKFQHTVSAENAIVIAKEVESRFAPSEDAVVHFKTYEGAQVRIIDKNNGWDRIKTLDGKIGWVPEASIEKI